jgi:hypothetical protein
MLTDNNPDLPPPVKFLKFFHLRWSAWLALIVVALLYQALPASLYWGPRGLMFGIVIALILLAIILRKNLKSVRVIGLSVNILVTLYMVISVYRIVYAVIIGDISPSQLLLSSMILWITNIFVSALWYWNIDAGGPHKRALTKGHGISAFLFPQTQICMYQASWTKKFIDWEPGFIDYLFLAFNTSTAFSPTDTPVITPWAKIMCMLQSIISLTIVIMLAARAINILTPGGLPPT